MGGAGAGGAGGARGAGGVKGGAGGVVDSGATCPCLRLSPVAGVESLDVDVDMVVSRSF